MTKNNGIATSRIFSEHQTTSSQGQVGVGHAAGPLAREFVRKLVELDFVEGKLELAAGE